MGYRYDEDTGLFVGTGDEEGQVFARREEEGGGFVNVAGEEYAKQQYQAPSYTNYDLALNNYSSRKVPWLYTSVSGDSGYGSTESQGGLSDRQAFNLNALWGGTQYAAGRVSDFTHIDPTQLQANQIAGNVRDELWNEYDRLKAQGNTPAKNPDEVALDFYVQTVGPQGSQYGYGPGANTILLTEAIKNKFLNQPEVISSTGSRYQTPASQLDAAKAFDESHKVGATVWKIFEDQGVSSGGFGRFIPLIIGAIAFPGMGAALAQAMGGTIAANIAAASIIGGLNAEIQGGDFIDGAIKSALTAGTGAALANVGVAAEVSSALESVGIDANLANSVANTAERAVTAAIVAEATGGDAASAIANTLVAAGVSAVRSEVTDIASNLTTGEAPADIQDTEISDAMTDSATLPQESLIVAPQQPEDVSRETVEAAPEVLVEELPVESVVEEPAVTPEILPEEIAPDEILAEIAPVEPEVPAEEVAPEEEPFLPEETLPEEVAIPEAMPEVEPEPVLPEEGMAEEEAAPEEEPAPEEPMPEESAIGDQEVLDALAEEDTGEGAEPEEGGGEEVAPEGEEVLPAEEPTEETPEEEPGTERQPTEAPSSLDKLIASLLLSEQGGGSGSQRRSVTQESISPREISGSVTGIIGKKQPMFSGDEDEQSAEWNRRSLRLRKVLGL